MRVFLLSLLFIMSTVSYGKERQVKSIDDLESLKPGVTYLINTSINLNGATIEVPNKCTLKFGINGCLSNGKLKGRNSALVAKKHIIIKDIFVSGEWNNKEVYSQWVSFSREKDHNTFFATLMNLCYGSELTHFYLEKGKYFVSAIPFSAPIIVPSNVYWHNDAVIQMLPNDYVKYNMVLILKSKNVTIDSGVFIGDVKDHISNKGEWGHGIKCSGASNIRLLNLTCREFWGDGIDIIEALDNNNEASINCNNVTIKKVKCLYNRRQGLSIEAGSNIKIEDSEFAYTGQIKYTIPAAGIDIEPWSDNKDKVWNVYIINSFLHDNSGFDLKCEPNVMRRESYKTLKNNVVVKRCKIGKCRIFYTYQISILDSDLYSYFEVTNSDYITVRRSSIKRYVKGRNVENIRFLGCDNQTPIIYRIKNSLRF